MMDVQHPAFRQQSRRACLQTWLAGAAGACLLGHTGWAAETKDVSWLNELQAPAGIKNSLSDLLLHEGQRLTTVEQWEAQAARLRAFWNEFLGPALPAADAAPRFRVLEEKQNDAIRRTLIEYDAEPGQPVQAYLCRPLRIEKPLPGLVAFHSTTQRSIEEPAPWETINDLAFGTRLAAQGFVVLCPRNYLWPTNDRLEASAAATAFLERHPQQKGMRRMVHDGQLALNLLAAMKDEVDPRRLGCLGHSLGAKEALYLAALDPRVQAAVACEGGVGLKATNWNAPWYLGSNVDRADFGHDHHELLALAAPRPLLVIGGNSADGEATWPYIERAAAVYRLYGNPPRCGLYNHAAGHAVTPTGFERITAWLKAYV